MQFPDAAYCEQPVARLYKPGQRRADPDLGQMAIDPPTSNPDLEPGIFLKGGDTGILLIHGLGGSPAELRFVAQGLARAGHTVYCCQLAGHGGSPEQLRRSHREQWRASAMIAFERLKARCGTVIVGGHSMGGLLALDLAARRPSDIQGILLFAPALRLDGWATGWLSRYILPYVRPFPRPTKLFLKERAPYGIKDERIRAFVVSNQQRMEADNPGAMSRPLHALAQFSALSADVRRRLPDIHAPTLILHPREDDVASLENAITIQRRLGGLVELVVLDDSYHIITLDRQRHIVMDRVVAFTHAVARKSAGEAAFGSPRHHRRSE